MPAKCERHPMFDMTGRTALVTGGGSGLGREFCDVLAEFGADIVCVDIYADRVAETCDIIKQHGTGVLPLVVDISDYEQVKDMFRQTLDRFGRLDVLINNAGVAPPAVFVDEVTLKDWHRVINVDLHGVFYCLHEGLAIMRRQGKGSVINISSVAGIMAANPEGLPQAAYVAAKHGIVGLTKQAAVEYGQFGVRVNCIAPGLHLPTRLPDSQGPPPKGANKLDMSDFNNAVPLRRAASPAEMKGLCLYLASDASGYVTGTIIPHDGGLSL